MILAVVAIIFGIFFANSMLGSITLHDQQIEVPNLKTYSLDEVNEELSSLGLTYKVIDSSAYTTTFPNNSVVKQNPTSGSFVKSGRVVYLTINPSSYKEVKVPNLVGKTSRSAVSYLKSVGFKLGKIEYRKDVGKNVVLDIKYKGEILDTNATLPMKSKLDLVLGSGRGNTNTIVPNLIAHDLNEAKNILIEFALNLGSVKYDEEKNVDKKYFIYKQSPVFNKNTRVSLGRNVNLWLTSDTLKLPIVIDDSLIDE